MNIKNGFPFFTGIYFFMGVVGGCSFFQEKNSTDDLNHDDLNSETGVENYFLPPELSFISWDYPAVAHTDLDLDYKMTGYDWFNRSLQWSVIKGPENMYFDVDGTLHWTPGEEGDYSVEIQLLIGNKDTVSKTFSIRVENSRCIFLSPTGNNSTGDGSIENPYQYFGEEVAAAINHLGGPCTVYHRAGIYQNLHFNWFDNTLFPNMRRVNLLELDRETSILVRNYPNEEPVLELETRGYSFYGGHWIVYGLEFSGGTGGEGGGVVLYGESVAKRLLVHGYDHSSANNPTGFQLAGNIILDQVIAWDNYDRNDPDLHNSSNFLFYGEKAEEPGHAYIIDSLSLGYSACGYKVKHAGDETILHLHKSAGLGTRRPLAMAENRCSVRHSVFHTTFDNPVFNGAVTDPTTNDERNTDDGMFLEHNIFVSNNSVGTALNQAGWAFYGAKGHPSLWKNNIVETTGTDVGNVYVTGRWTSSVVADGWSIRFEDNQIFTPNPANAVIFKGETYPLSWLLDYGAGNQIMQQQGVYSFTVAGRPYQIKEGLLQEL